MTIEQLSSSTYTCARPQSHNPQSYVNRIETRLIHTEYASRETEEKKERRREREGERAMHIIVMIMIPCCRKHLIVVLLFLESMLWMNRHFLLFLLTLCSSSGELTVTHRDSFIVVSFSLSLDRSRLTCSDVTKDLPPSILEFLFLCIHGRHSHCFHPEQASCSSECF